MIMRVCAGIVIGVAAVAKIVAQAPPATEIFRQPPKVSGPAPHLANGIPDLSGTWMGGGSNSGDISKGLKAGEQVSMLPWAEKVYKERLAKDDPEANCLPFGIPRSAP